MHYLIRLYAIITIILLFLTACSSSDKDTDASNTAEQLYIADVKTQLNVREEPSAQSQILGYYLPGDTVHVVGIEGKWAAALSRYGEIGYVITDHLKPLQTTTPLPTQDNIHTTAKHLFAVIDSTGVLTENEKSDLTALTVILDRPVIVYATDTLPVNQIIDQPETVRKALKNSEYKSVLDSASIFYWIASSRLLQYTDETKATEYMILAYPEKYFDNQLLAKTDGVATGALGMARLISDCQKEYQSFYWIKRNNISKENFVETVCDSFIAENILPNDTFWHKWILGWLFKYPFIFASFILSLFGSTRWAMIFIGIMIIAEQIIAELYVAYRIRNGKDIPLNIIFIKFPISAFLWLTLISYAVYMFPDMTTVTVLEKTGASADLISVISSQFSLAPIRTGIISSIIFVALMLIVGTLDVKTIIYSSLSSEQQRFLFSKEHKEIKREATINRFFDAVDGNIPSELDPDKLTTSDNPFTEIFVNNIGEHIGKMLIPAIVLAYILNGTLLVFGIIFMSIKFIKKLVMIYFGFAGLNCTNSR